jgi:hypothetical protein
MVFDGLYWRRGKLGLNLLITAMSHKRIRMSIFDKVVCESGGMGANRIDHDSELWKFRNWWRIWGEGIVMMLCAWAYLRHHKEDNVFRYTRKLFDAGVLLMLVVIIQCVPRLIRLLIICCSWKWTEGLQMRRLWRCDSRCGYTLGFWGKIWIDPESSFAEWIFVGLKVLKRNILVRHTYALISARTVSRTESACVLLRF